MEFPTVTSVKEEFITLYRSDPNVEDLVDEFVGSFVQARSFAEGPELFCQELRHNFAQYRVPKVRDLLAAPRQATRNKRSDTKKLTGEPAVQLRTLCVLLATRCLEFHGSQSIYDPRSFVAAYPQFAASPDIADLIRFCNFMIGMRAFQPYKAVVGLSLKMCICLAHGPTKTFSTGGTVPKLERVAVFSNGNNDGVWVARRLIIFYHETGTERKPRAKSSLRDDDRADSVATTSASVSTSSVNEDGRLTSEGMAEANILVHVCSEPGVCSKRKTASWDVDSVSSLDDSVCADKRRRGDSLSSGSAVSGSDDALPAYVGEPELLSVDPGNNVDTTTQSELLAEAQCGPLDSFDIDLEALLVYQQEQ
jgi:hypothetical protein